MEFTFTQAKELIREIGRFEELSNEHYGLTMLKADNGEYAIGTDSECDDAQDENLESYIDECILPDLNENYQNYFDRESWKRDARYYGRGHCLSSYDGNEIEIDGDLYLYRTN
ncbi:MAG: hypothetical protein DRP97_03035 [Candidatus Latescibacterota bacterium]|nr:MAG: hypothetical protein DRP97_03035 [Candidatus Latescibacterota bacterium]